MGEKIDLKIIKKVFKNGYRVIENNFYAFFIYYYRNNLVIQ